MEIKLFQIDAFASRVFQGNPAAVCPLEKWLPDETMQNIAAENNLSETAFFVPKESGFHIRWFTPTTEVDLCGHATLASAYALYHLLGDRKGSIEFASRSGNLRVTQKGDWIEMDFPNQNPTPCDPPEALLQAFDLKKCECLESEDYLLILENERKVQNANPDLEKLKTLDLRGVIVSSPGDTHDFVSRFFAPKFGIPEDPVTGSAHTQLAPYWSEKLKKRDFFAKQISRRGGELKCTLAGDRVLISGQALLYLSGEIQVPD